jgi:TPR repeat protein
MKRFAPLAILLAALVMPAAHAEANDNLEALKRAATGGDTAAQYEMGVLYEFGFNMPDNLVPAFVWYSAAAEGGDERAAKRRDLLRGQLSPAQVEEAARMRAELVARPAAAPPAEPAKP